MAYRPTRLFFLCVGLSLACAIWSEAARASDVRAGVAKEALQLPPRVPLAGYSRRKGEPSSGVHDPVSVRALLFEADGTAVALVSSDLLIIDETLCDAVSRRLAAEGFSGIHLIFAATHTHSGPGAYGVRFFEKISMGHFNRAVFDEIVRAVTQAIRRAHETLAPVRVAYVTSLTEGLIKNRVLPDGPLRRALTVCALYHPPSPEASPLGGEKGEARVLLRSRADKATAKQNTASERFRPTGVQEGTTGLPVGLHDAAQPFAVLVDFSAHPTTLGAWNRELSADYPGVVMREVERHVPGATCLFFAGAVGDQAPAKHGSGFETAEYLGGALAQQVIRTLDGAHLGTPTGLATSEQRYRLPPAQVRLGWLVVPRWLGARLVDDDATLSLAAVGGTLFVGVPCDLAAALGETLEAAAASRGFHPMIIGFANDYIGYCVPRALYEKKKYESSMAFNGPLTGELVVQRLIAMMDRVAGHDR